MPEITPTKRTNNRNNTKNKGFFQYISVISRLSIFDREGRSISFRAKDSKNAIKANNTDSPINCRIRSPLTAPFTFLIPISRVLLSDWAVTRLIKFITAIRIMKNASAVKM